MKLLLLSFLVLVILQSCSPKSTGSKGWATKGEDGFVYSYHKITFNQSMAPLFVISKTSPENIGSKVIYKASSEGFRLYDTEVVQSKVAMLYFGQDGVVDSMELDNTGIYTPLFRSSGPTTSELNSIITHHLAL